MNQVTESMVSQAVKMWSDLPYTTTSPVVDVRTAFRNILEAVLLKHECKNCGEALYWSNDNGGEYRHERLRIRNCSLYAEPA